MSELEKFSLWKITKSKLNGAGDVVAFEEDECDVAGEWVGSKLGLFVTAVGLFVGTADGLLVTADGLFVTAVGLIVVTADGLLVGEKVGLIVGADVGAVVTDVGADVAGGHWQSAEVALDNIHWDPNNLIYQ